jgi:hypothetical protein
MSGQTAVGRAIVCRQGRIKYDVMPDEAQRKIDYATYRRAFKKEPDGILVAGVEVNLPTG